MCGIIGIVSQQRVSSRIVDALYRLEYRGYDSAGIAVVNDGVIEIRKGVGKVAEVEESCSFRSLKGKVGIGHVRWATHGKVSSKNAHPHEDCSGRIAVVHNGIIENYEDLRDELIEAGHSFMSDTDTEVVSHLMEQFADEGLILEESMLRCVGKLRGSFALLAISTEQPDTIVAARRDSPLVVGIGEDAKILASDIFCIAGQASQVVDVEDGEVVVITKDDVRIMGDQGIVYREPAFFDGEAVEVTKQNHDYFMIKEIIEQPYSIGRAIEQDSAEVMDMAMDILRTQQLVFTASGTSRYAALVGRYAFSKLARKLGEVVWASEFQYFTDPLDRDTLVIAISQSGETADVLQGVKRAKKQGAPVFSLINTPGSTLSKISDRVLYLKCGPEMGVAATKSFISEISIFYMLAYAMTNRLQEGIDILRELSQQVHAIIERSSTHLAMVAHETSERRDFYYLGRGINFAIAGEGALKMKEIAYVHAEGMSAGELKHGTLALIEPGTPVIAICPTDYTFTETISNVIETKARGAYVIGVSDQEHSVFDEWVWIPKVDELFYPLVSVIPLQILAYYASTTRGLNPDRPRNLAKSVTVI